MNSFLTGYLTADLATRKDKTAEVEGLRGEADSARKKLEGEREIALAGMNALMSWKATAHYLQARLKARRQTEEELLEQLTAAEVYSIPLGDADSFEKQYTKNFTEALIDPEVIEKTFEDGIPSTATDMIEGWKKREGIE